MELLVKNQLETKKLAEIFSENIKKNGAFVSLSGEIGAGKTAFARYLIKSLGVIENVTSPSFVILNEYKTKYFPVYHFDLYRLEETGIGSIKEELREYSKENILTLVEWANFGEDELYVDKIEINIKYDIKNYSEERIFNFEGNTPYYKDIIKKTAEDFNKRKGLN